MTASKSTFTSSSSSQTAFSIQITPSTPPPPPRGRLPSRYPSSLARGEPDRVPLHRRGTSRTYERLEDLLREAGYKETRVFTPESERAERDDEERNGSSQSTVRGGMSAVVDFIAGWMPGATTTSKNSDEAENRSSPNVSEISEIDIRYSLPPSPLGHKHHPRSESPMLSSNAARYNSSSASPRLRNRHMDYSHPLPHPSLQRLRPQPSASESLRTYAQVSAAKASLRHMASTPNISKGRPSTSSGRRIVTSTPNEPPLPNRWLDSVTKAVLGSASSGSYAGGPSTSRPSRFKGKDLLTDNMDPGDRSISNSGPLTGYLQRAPTAPNALTTVRVVCRSAPASRSSSRARHAVHPNDRNFDVLAASRRDRNPKRGCSRREQDHVPSLINMDLEGNDIWDVQWIDGKRVSIRHSHSHHTSASYQSGEDSLSDDEDEDGEIDLARILVPPKRQHSIRSLRRHLHRCEADNMRRKAVSGSEEPWHDDDGGMGSKNGSIRGYHSRRGSSEIGEGLGYGGWEAQGGVAFVGTARKRRGIPVWASSTSGR
ncbi:hypothetical protein C8Q75DRAFT_746076 [Abortiporus biennis]|nr:hypothetical protein C8Q75DRAFT_746076 [Abortiporus biennis]